MNNVYYGNADGIRYAYLNCPKGCGHQCKADASTGDESARISVAKKMNLHLPNCSNNPERVLSEMEKFKKGLGL